MKKITNIDIKINSQKFPKDKSTWITIGNTLYISWRTGRSYFNLNTAHKEIQNMKFNDEEQIISWTYKGLWENMLSGKGSIKTKNFKLIFHNSKDYNAVKKAMFK